MMCFIGMLTKQLVKHKELDFLFCSSRHFTFFRFVKFSLLCCQGYTCPAKALGLLFILQTFLLATIHITRLIKILLKLVLKFINIYILD